MTLRTAATLILLAASGPFAGTAQADTTECTAITSTGVTLTEQGVYCLKVERNYGSTSTAAITVAANNVTIDCNGYAINQSFAFPNATVGIKAVGRNNITIRNCALRGFQSGIDVSGDGIVVEDTVVQNTSTYGIRVVGNNGLIRRNRLVGLGGQPGSVNPVAIFTQGSVDVVDNLVAGVTGRPDSNDTIWGIRSIGAIGARIAGNRIYDLQPTGTGQAAGTTVLQGSDNVVTGNTLMQSGTGSGIGVSCDNPGTAVVSGNQFIGWGTVTLTCLAVSNVIKP